MGSGNPADGCRNLPCASHPTPSVPDRPPRHNHGHGGRHHAWRSDGVSSRRCYLSTRRAGDLHQGRDAPPPIGGQSSVPAPGAVRTRRTRTNSTLVQLRDCSGGAKQQWARTDAEELRGVSRAHGVFGSRLASSIDVLLAETYLPVEVTYGVRHVEPMAVKGDSPCTAPVTGPLSWLLGRPCLLHASPGPQRRCLRSLPHSGGNSGSSAVDRPTRCSGSRDSRSCPAESYNYPDRYIRHYAYQLKLDPITTATGRSDATFRVTS